MHACAYALSSVDKFGMCVEDALDLRGFASFNKAHEFDEVSIHLSDIQADKHPP